MTSLWPDIRYALRMLRQSPGFTAVAILSLALGIGANSAIFTLVNAALLRPPSGVHDPETLLTVWSRPTGRNGYGSISYPDYIDTRDQAGDVLSGLAAFSMRPVDSRTGTRTERLASLIVSPNFFEVLGTPMHIGRTFLPEEDQGQPVVVISYALWQRRFALDRTALGRTISLNGHPFTIIGVTPPGFHGLNPIAFDIWLPLATWAQVTPSRAGTWNTRSSSYLQLIGRRKPGVSLQRAQARLEVIAHSLATAYPKEWADFRDGKPRSYIAIAGDKSYLPPEPRQGIVAFLTVLMVVVGMVLLTACANIANLLLARSTARRKEIAIRQSLGASRWRVVRQLLTENVILSMGGGALALVLAVWAGALLLAFKPPIDVPLVVDLSVDWRVFAFTSGIALLTGMLFGLAPALAATRPDVAPDLKDNAASTTVSFRRFGLRNLLTAGQAALSMILLIGSGLFLRSLQNANSIDIGFNPRNVLTVPMDLSTRGYKEDQGRAAHARIVAAAQQMPGVKSVDLVRMSPLSMSNAGGPLTVEGEPAHGEMQPTVSMDWVGPRYFETMEVPVLLGRGFRETDRQGAPNVVVVNQAFANEHWSGQNPVGKRIALVPEPKPSDWKEVVGVVATGKYMSLGEDPRPFVFVPYEQDYQPRMQLLVRTERRDAAAPELLRKTLFAADPDLPVEGLMTMEESIGAVLLPARLGGAILGAFGALALVLAAVGLYGVMAYLVAQRTREMGIRMALGARPADVRQMILKRGMSVALTGMAIGMAIAFAVTRFAASMLYGTSPTDPVTFGGVFLLLAGVALLACLIPARRAAAVDPMVALRYE